MGPHPVGSHTKPQQLEWKLDFRNPCRWRTIPVSGNKPTRWVLKTCCGREHPRVAKAASRVPIPCPKDCDQGRPLGARLDLPTGHHDPAQLLQHRAERLTHSQGTVPRQVLTGDMGSFNRCQLCLLACVRGQDPM